MSGKETYDAAIMEQEQKLTKKDLRGVYNTWYFSTELSNSYERLQALAFCNAISKPLRKLYKDDEKYKDALKRHLQFYNSEGTFGCMIHGIVLSMEEQKSGGAEIPGEVITGIKTGLMGPMAGIGDTIIWGTLKAIILALACTFAMQGQSLGALIPFLFPLTGYFIGWYCLTLGYKVGKDSIMKVMQSGLINDIITGSSILGLFMMGALSSSYVKVKTVLQFSMENTTEPIVLQNILDQILPGMLPLAVIFGIYYYFTHKGANYNKVIFGLLGISLLCALLGILG